MQEYTQNLLLDGCYLLFEEYLQDETSVYILKTCREKGQKFEESLQGGELNNNRRKAILIGLPRGDFFCGEGAAVHTQAAIKPCPDHCVACRTSCESETNSFEHCNLLEDLCNEKNEYHFYILKSGMYSNFSNFTIMNKK